MVKLLKSVTNKLVFIPLGVVLELMGALYNRIRLQLFYNRSEIIRLLAAGQRELVEDRRPKLLAVITHVFANALTGVKIDPNDEKNRTKVERRVENLTRTIDGLLRSFGHCELHIVINTVRDMHLTQYLKEEDKKLIRVVEQENCPPLFVLFRAQDEFAGALNDYDWFLSIEDDIVINDGCFLDKLMLFNSFSQNGKAILLPHRYEMLEGRKIYIDRDFNGENTFVWNRLSLVNIGPVQFAEFENPHAAMYCLSKDQTGKWMSADRKWYRKITFVSPLESADTGCLFECFKIYKPHLSNMHFLEVEHLDTYYSRNIVSRKEKWQLRK